MNYQFQNLFKNAIKPPTNIGTRVPWFEQEKRDPWQDLTLQREQEIQQQEAPSNKGIDIISALKGIQEAKNGPARTAYSDFLANGLPKEEDYERSKWAKLGAILAGGLGAYGGDSSAPQKAISALRSPYERALEAAEIRGKYLGAASDYETEQERNQIQSLKAIGDIEDTRVDNERLAANERNKFTEYVRPVDGMRIRVYNDGRREEIGQDDESLEQKQARVLEAARIAREQATYNQDRSDGRFFAGLDSTNARAAAAQAATDARAAANQAAIDARANKPKPPTTLDKIRIITDVRRELLGGEEFGFLMGSNLVIPGAGGTVSPNPEMMKGFNEAQKRELLGHIDRFNKRAQELTDEELGMSGAIRTPVQPPVQPNKEPKYIRLPDGTMGLNPNYKG